MLEGLVKESNRGGLKAGPSREVFVSYWASFMSIPVLTLMRYVDR